MISRDTNATTGAFTLIKAQTEIAIAMFSDVIQLRVDHVPFSAECPYKISDEDLNEICDTARWPIMKRIASSPRFPFDFQQILPAIQSAKRNLSKSPHARQVTRGNPLYRTSHMHVQQLMSHVRRVCSLNSAMAVMAFDLKQPEIRELTMVPDAAFIEAAPMIRLEFRTDHFRDILRVQSDRKSSTQPSPIIEHILGASGFARLRHHL